MSGVRHDLVVLGGGPAGAAAACLLASAGRRPLLLERETEPRHKICGEFLSIEAQASLRALGLDPESLGAAPIERVRLASGRSLAEAPLPFLGLGLTRRSLDEALLRHAEAMGVEVRRGVTAREVQPDGNALRVALADGTQLRTPTLFLGTGKHDVRGVKRPAFPGSDDLIGFKDYFRLAPAQRRALEGAIEVLLFDGGYAGLQLVEGGMANLCLLVQRELFKRIGKTWEALLRHLLEECPHLRERLAGAEPLLEKPLSIFQIPYGHVHDPEADEPPGLFRLGDQVGVIPSFSGDGMSIALHTGRLAAATYLKSGNAAGAYHRQARADIAGQIRLASFLYRISRNPVTRSGLLVLCRAAPGAMRAMALRTRVPESALRRTGLDLALRA